MRISGPFKMTMTDLDLKQMSLVSHLSSVLYVVFWFVCLFFFKDSCLYKQVG